ncbi:AI-2E family transporter [Cellulosimicrobium marinum]|uniref:AI-2E family transporter n=1 Tax=Cellulosimicrobium marinum TaxID=1638992 RepID=UPI001E48502B|nr:AI-2E family transporter [Cellulosimicrobium marinum]MCB7135899.1 AI-2E family transporter [Cellulosimicrobium marinum]
MSVPDDDRLVRAGRRAWAVVGLVLVAALAYAAFSALSGLVVPLVLAAVLGVLLHPLVDRLHGVGVARGVGAGLVLLGLAALVVLAVWVTVVGVIDQWDEIAARVSTGLAEVDERVDVDLSALRLSPDDVTSGSSTALGGVAGLFGSVFSSVAAFVVGTGVAVFFLYYMLADWARIERAVSRYTRVGRTSGRVVLGEATTTLGRYFGALTASSALTAVVIGVAAALLDVPLAFSIALVTFVTSYVPYLGAIFSGAFAVLVALGAQGPAAALWLLVVILAVQSVLQTLVLTKLSSDRLRLHPIVNLSSTIVGAALAGVLGAMLSAPVAVMVRDVAGHLGENPSRGGAPDLVPGTGPEASSDPAPGAGAP